MVEQFAHEQPNVSVRRLLEFGGTEGILPIGVVVELIGREVGVRWILEVDADALAFHRVTVGVFEDLLRESFPLGLELIRSPHPPRSRGRRPLGHVRKRGPRVLVS